MKKLLILLALFVGTLIPHTASAQFNGCMPGFCGAISGGGGGCSQATAFLARNGNVHPTETTKLICDLVSATYSGGGSMFSHLDFLHVATDTAAHYNLNLISTNYTLSGVGTTPSYTANIGYVGAGTGALNTGFTPSTAGGNFQASSASMGFCVNNARTASDNSTFMGANDTSSNFSQQTLLQGGNFVYDINDLIFSSFANTNTQGLWGVSRTGSVASPLISLYKGTSATAIASSNASIPNTNIGFSLYILGTNQGGSLANSSSDTVSADFAGAALTGADYATIAGLLHTYLAAIGVSGC